MNQQALASLTLAVKTIMDAVEAAGSQGAPSGPMYAAMSAHGMTLNAYNSIIGALESAGKIRQSGQVLYFVSK